jgi:hypothetical protein
MKVNVTVTLFEGKIKSFSKGKVHFYTAVALLSRWKASLAQKKVLTACKVAFVM